MLKDNPIILIAIAVVGFGGLLISGVAVFFLFNAWFGLPVGASAPDQPIDYPHTIHADSIENGGLGLDCTFCHRNVADGAAATVPSVQQCMFCHKQITGTSDKAKVEIGKLRDISDSGQPINWKRVHRLPDHVEFVHDAHIRYFSEKDGVSTSEVCSTCHGDVASMLKVKQVRALKMGDCVDCHREYSAPTDCTICHR
tara:strand:- start:4537 stop:5130 length:594 start_codon:yes stop_codon:yes gene_type:complete